MFVVNNEDANEWAKAKGQFMVSASVNKLSSDFVQLGSFFHRVGWKAAYII